MKALGSVLDIVPGVVPVDLHGAAQPGDFISLKNAEGCLVVFFKAIGTAHQDPTLELQQATVVAGTDAKDLLGFVTIYKKQGALLSCR